MGRLFLPLLALAALGPQTGVSGQAPEPRVTLSFRGTPLRAALDRLYEGSGVVVSVDGQVPDAPITVELRDVARPAALRAMLRISGIAGLTSGPAAVPEGACGSITISLRAGFVAPAGVSTGPNGIQVPNQSGTFLQSTRRARTPTYLGGATGGTSSAVRSGVPFLPLGSRTRSGTSRTGGIFITVTPLPDPETPRTRGR